MNKFFLVIVVLGFQSVNALAVPAYFCGTTDDANSYGMNGSKAAAARAGAVALCRKHSRNPSGCGQITQCRAYEGRTNKAFSSIAAFSRTSRGQASASYTASTPAPPAAMTPPAKPNEAADSRPRTGSTTGSVTRYEDGSYSTQTGDITRYSDGSYKVRTGDVTRSSDGSYAVQTGDITRFSDGSYAVKTGDVTRYSNGKVCVNSGSTNRCF